MNELGSLIRMHRQRRRKNARGMTEVEENITGEEGVRREERVSQERETE